MFYTKYESRLNVAVKSRRGNTGTHMNILISCCRVAPEFLRSSSHAAVWEQEDMEKPESFPTRVLSVINGFVFLY